MNFVQSYTISSTTMTSKTLAMNFHSKKRGQDTQRPPFPDDFRFETSSAGMKGSSESGTERGASGYECGISGLMEMVSTCWVVDFKSSWKESIDLGGGKTRAPSFSQPMFFLINFHKRVRLV